MGRSRRRRREPIDEEDVAPRGLLILFAVLLTPVLLALAISGVLSWWHERDLRDESALVRTQARIVHFDSGGRGGRDALDIEFTTTDGRRVAAEVPVGHALRSDEGSRIAVLYVESDPRRVRPVDDWQPWYQQAIVYTVMAAIIAPVIFVWMLLEPKWKRLRRRVLRR